jgi:hypothetical protein
MAVRSASHLIGTYEQDTLRSWRAGCLLVLTMQPYDAGRFPLRRWTLPLRGVPLSFPPASTCCYSRSRMYPLKVRPSVSSRRSSPPSRCTSARNVPRELHWFSAADRSAYDRDAYEFEPAGGTPLRVERWPYAWMEYFPRQRHA